MVNVAQKNRELISTATSIFISERLAPLKGTVTREEVTEGSKKKILHTAKVSHADKVNQNNRLYPREVIAANIERLKPLLAEGFLTGAVDHGYGGNLQDTCLLWRDIWIEADGAVKAKFEVITNHSRGADFKAQIDAGMAVGFSTSGYGSAHQPSAAERLQYGLGDDTEAVVMDGNYTLKKIDAVDDPSVEDARLSESAEHQDDAPDDEWEDAELRRAQERVAKYYRSIERRC